MSQNLLQEAEYWLNNPIPKDIPEALESAEKLLDRLRAELKLEGSPKSVLGDLIGRISGLQKKIAALKELDWVAIDSGYLAIGHRPGSNLMSDLKLQGTTHILTLLSESEGAKNTQAQTVKNGMKWIWFPMSSANPVSKSRYPELKALFDQMKEVLTKEGKIYLHCSAGIHRTGMISYAFLRYNGADKETALSLLKELRVETSNGVGDYRIAWGEEVLKEL